MGQKKTGKASLLSRVSFRGQSEQVWNRRSSNGQGKTLVVPRPGEERVAPRGIVWEMARKGRFIYSCFKAYLFILSERARECQLGRDRESRKERESQAGSILPAQSLARGLIPRTWRSWHELKLRVGCLTDWVTDMPRVLLTFSTSDLFPKFNIDCLKTSLFQNWSCG